MAIKATIDATDYSGIESISVGGKTIALDETYEGSVEISTNGTHDVSGKAQAVVNVSQEARMGEKSVKKNGTYAASSDNLDGFSSVTVNVETPTISLQAKTVVANGDVTADEGYDGLSKVTVNVPSSGISIADVAMKNWGMTATTDLVLPDSVTEIKFGVFAGVPLKSVTGSALEKIREYAFYQRGLLPASSVVEVHFPKATLIEEKAFFFCTRLTTLDAPEVETIGDHALSICYALTSLTLPKCKYFAASSDGDGTVYSLNALTVLDLPAAIRCGRVQNCSELVKILTPVRTYNPAEGAYKDNKKLEVVDCGLISQNNISMFYGCTSLKTVIFRNTEAMVKSTYTLGSGPDYASATLYVPSALVDTYKADSKWGTFGTIAAIEGSEWELV